MNFACKSGKNSDWKFQKYVGVQSWKAAHLLILEIRVEQRGNRIKKGKKEKKSMLPRPGIEPGVCFDKSGPLEDPV